MLRKVGAILLVVGLCLPYGCDTTPVTILWTSWSEPAQLVFLGVPILLAIAYVLHVFVPPLARFHERNGPALHGVFRAVFFGLAGGYLASALNGEADARWFWGAALLASGALLYWQQQRGSKAERLPLLLLVAVGIPAVGYFLVLLDAGAFKVGAWVLTAGYLVAVVAEVRALRGAARITHGG